MPTSDKQLAANRANAAKSTGPRTPEGKARSAVLSFQRALAKDPENLPAMNGLAFSQLNMGKPAEAKVLFEKYLVWSGRLNIAALARPELP